MSKNILIVSSDYTGHGHKSITESLREQIDMYPDVNLTVVDGFYLGGNIAVAIGKLYGSVTRNAKELWRLVWEISLKRPRLICEITELSIKDSFVKVINEIKPDLILSVHPNFNGAVINILESEGLKIPFVIFIADLVSITPLWADARADYIICPTEEARNRCMELGVPSEKLKVSGFPVRSRFTQNADRISKDYSYVRPLECLIMSGGEGSGNMGQIAKILLRNFNCNLKIVAGRNATMRKRLERTLAEKYPGRVEVFGFVDNIQDLMSESDIAFTRGSPNVMMEAVMCNTPLIITGCLPGQEEGNPGYAEKYSLGVVCTDIKNLKDTISDLLADNASRLNEIKRSQREYRNPNTAKDIVNFLLEVAR